MELDGRAVRSMHGGDQLGLFLSVDDLGQS